jgi:DNA-binding response OmpR family regulator
MANTSHHILVAEDERPVAKALQLKLEHSGFTVSIVENGEDALKMLGEQKIDLLILDLMMPKLDGFGVLEAMKEKGIKTPVMVASNLSQTEDIERAKKLGAKDYYIKSDTPVASVVEHVEKMLDS